MRNLTWVLQVSAHCSIGLAILMLAFAEGSVSTWIMCLFSVGVLSASLFGQQRWSKLQLSPAAANVFGVLAVGLAGWECWADRASVEARLISGAHLLVYLSWILLLQPKKLNRYWWLFALAVLEIAIGSILTKSGYFGVMLVVFLFSAIWTLTLFSLHQAAQRFTQPGDGDDLNGTATPPESIPSAPPTGPAQPLLLQNSNAVGAIQHEDAVGWLNTKYVMGIGGMTCVALAIAMLFFLLIPRRWIGPKAWGANHTNSGQRRVVGFADTVQLGDIGKILESNERVMEVRLFDHKPNEPAGSDVALDVEEYAKRLGYDEPLFRGQVLDTYNNGQWTRSRNRMSPRSVNRRPFVRTVRQEIRLAPIGTNVLFSIQPNPIRPVEAARLSDDESELFHRRIGSVLVLGQQQRSNMQRIHYEVFTVPAVLLRRERPSAPRTLDEASWSRYLQLPANRLERLVREAREIADRQMQDSAKDNREIARQIVSYLRDGGRFTYSLKARRVKFSIDPVEEFLDRKTGHCEYFASALALMLRAVGIPARVISGFKGGTLNQLSGFYEVEQRHAHAWVEALIDGRWHVFDATPTAGRQQSLAGLDYRLRSWRDFVNLVSDLWNVYVIDMSFGDQQKKLYAPMKETADGVWDVLTGKTKNGPGRWQALKTFLSNPQMWFSWRGGLIAFVLMLAAVGVFLVLRKLLALLGRVENERSAQHRDQAMRIEFYERFRILCARMGLTRAASQTDREFAGTVSAAIEQRFQASIAAVSATEIAETFYQIRFGHRPVSSTRRAEIESQLTTLENTLNQPLADNA